MMEQPRTEDEIMRRALQTARVIAVVGLSDNPMRTSYGIARYLQQAGYRIVPVNPEVTEVLGERAYPNLQTVPYDIDLVNMFRRSSLVGVHVDEAIDKGANMVWMQLGVVDHAAAEHARRAGLDVVMNRCIMVEHRRLLGR